MAILGMCNWTYQWFRPDGAKTSAEIADYFAGLLLCGLSNVDRRDATIPTPPTAPPVERDETADSTEIDGQL
jgi:hypothetical protein